MRVLYDQSLLPKVGDDALVDNVCLLGLAPEQARRPLSSPLWRVNLKSPRAPKNGLQTRRLQTSSKVMLTKSIFEIRCI